MQYVLIFSFNATKNDVEYKALCVGLSIAKKLKAQNFLVISNSQIIVNQVQGQYQTKKRWMKHYLKKVMELLKSFNHLSITIIPWSANAQAEQADFDS